AANAWGVRKVISSMRMPPATKACAMGTAKLTSSTTMTGITAASLTTSLAVKIWLTAMCIFLAGAAELNTKRPNNSQLRLCHKNAGFLPVPRQYMQQVIGGQTRHGIARLMGGGANMRQRKHLGMRTQSRVQ